MVQDLDLDTTGGDTTNTVAATTITLKIYNLDRREPKQLD
jgi:hypothetical protein